MIDDTVRTASIGVLVMLAVGLVGQYYFATAITQPMSEVGLLGPTGTFSGYPSQMVVGTNYTLELYLVNHEGKSMIYAVYEEIGGPASMINQTVPLSSNPVETYWFVLPNNGTLVRPITVSLNSTGQDVRLVWELWAYSVGSSSWTYTGAWAQLFVNATES
jgi:uncharacterized membrane protein